jgi:TolB protein
MSARGSGQRVVDHCRNCGLSRLAWSPTGRRIAWSRGSGLFVSLAAGGPQDRMPGVDGMSPTWRPDNSGLAFSMGGKIATLDRRQQPDPIADGHDPSWCRGDRIAFVGYDHWLMTSRPDGSDQRRVTHGVYAEAPDCSPDGRRLLFGNGKGVYVSRVDGSSSRRVLAPARAMTPVWSPSGRRIAWSDGHDIWIARADASHARKVTRNSHYGAYLAPSWQPLP